MDTTQYNRSIFQQFFNSTDASVIAYRANLLEKVYKRGIIPEYIVRDNDNNSNGEDADYISYWTSICEVLAFYVIYGRAIYTFPTNKKLLLDYLINRNVGVNSSDTLANYQYLMSKFWDGTRLRGTVDVFRKINVGAPEVFDGVVPPSKNIDGELVRTLAHTAEDEFMAVMTDPINFGWCVGRSSPLYRGTLFDYQLIKGYESTNDAKDATKYPTIGAGVSIVTDSAISHDVLKFTVNSGFGWDGANTRKAIVINQSVNYEFTFNIKTHDIAKINFGVDFFDENYNVVASKYIDGTASSSLFISDKGMWKDDRYYSVRGIIFGVNETVRAAADSTMDIGVGKHIQIPCGAIYAVPRIVMSSGNSGASYVYINDFKMRIADTVYSRGFVQTPNVIQLWAENNNGMYNTYLQKLLYSIHPLTYQNLLTIPLLEDFVRRYLIPYNCTIIFNWLTSNNVCNFGLQDDSGQDIQNDNSDFIQLD